MSHTITGWHIIKDSITESSQPSGSTEIEVTYTPRPRETVEQAILRTQLDCYDYIDRGGYSCRLGAPHPLNDNRLRGGYFPVFLQSFHVNPDALPDNPWAMTVTLNWAVAENVEGVTLEREPPRRFQHIIPGFSLRDPNTFFPHTTSAGEIIRNVPFDEGYGALGYTLRLPEIPAWYEALERRPMNRDTVRLDGTNYAPRKLWVVRCEATPIKIRQGVYWREIALDLLINPDGWDELYPNVGHFELLLKGTTRVAAVGANGRPVYRNGRRVYTNGESVEIMARINSREDANRYAAAARSGRPIRIEGVTGGVYITQNYTPIQNYLFFPYMEVPQPEIVDVEKPVMIDENGLAFRLAANGQPLKTTGFDPEDIVTRKLTTRKLVDLSPIGLW